MSEEEFWDLTPAQYFALVRQAKLEVMRADKRAGELVALVYNMFAKTPKDPSYWFPSLRGLRRKLSPEERALQERINSAKLKRGLGWRQKE